jgi:hypothetical protein
MDPPISMQVKYCSVIHNTVEAMKRDMDADSLCSWMARVNNMMTK